MKPFLFLVVCFTVAAQAFGQSNTNVPTNTNNGVLQNNSSVTEEEEKIRLEVPATNTMPDLMREAEQASPRKKEKMSVSKESSISSSGKFSNSRKIASTQLTSRSPSPMQQQEMDEAVGFYKANAPESFEYHYFKYAGGNYDISLFPHLQKAMALKPNNSDVIAQVAAYNIIVNDSVEAAKNLTQLVEIGKIEPEVLNYGTDMLTSVPTGGVLLTHGFDDSYSAFYLNSVAHLRTDVKVISLDFMQSKVYRDSLKNDGFKIPASNTVDVAFMREFCASNEDKNLFISMTFPKPYLAPLADKLNIHGLVFSYGVKQSAILEDNEVLWDKILKNDFTFKTEKGKQLSSNYLPLLFYLRESYQNAGLMEKVAEIDKAIDCIGVQSNKFSKVNSMRSRK